MSIYLHTFFSILVLGILIILVVLFRKKGVLKEENGILFSRLVTQVTLPALIFSSLANSTIEWDYILLFLIMLTSELVLFIFAWFIGKSLKLPHKQMGSFLLVSIFGSSALLGYAVIIQLFPDNTSALAEGVFISELGVGLPLFTLGVFIAMYYGKENQKVTAVRDNVLLFFKSPIFIAIVLGVLWSFSPLETKGLFITPLFEVIYIIGKANTFLVALTVGVLLNFSTLSNIVRIAFSAIVLKLIVAPLLVYFPANILSLESWQLQVLLLESSMPSAMLSVVLARQYGCDAKLAAQLVFITLVFSLFSVSIMMNL